MATKMAGVDRAQLQQVRAHANESATVYSAHELHIYYGAMILLLFRGSR
jgi:hypothetical protein